MRLESNLRPGPRPGFNSVAVQSQSVLPFVSKQGLNSALVLNLPRTLAPEEAETEVVLESHGLWPQEAVKIHRKSKQEMVGKVVFFHNFRFLFLQMTGNVSKCQAF